MKAIVRNLDDMQVRNELLEFLDMCSFAMSGLRNRSSCPVLKNFRLENESKVSHLIRTQKPRKKIEIIIGSFQVNNSSIIFLKISRVISVLPLLHHYSI